MSGDNQRKFIENIMLEVKLEKKHEGCSFRKTGAGAFIIRDEDE